MISTAHKVLLMPSDRIGCGGVGCGIVHVRDGRGFSAIRRKQLISNNYGKIEG